MTKTIWLLTTMRGEMSTETETLEIRHQVAIDGDMFVVRELFGDRKLMEWRVDTLNAAKALVDARKAGLLRMISDISPEAAEAVANARHIDNLKAGNA